MNSTSIRRMMLAVGLIGLLGAGLAEAATIYVTPSGSGAGTPDWASATSLTNAVAIAGATDEI